MNGARGKAGELSRKFTILLIIGIVAVLLAGRSSLTFAQCEIPENPSECPKQPAICQNGECVQVECVGDTDCFIPRGPARICENNTCMEGCRVDLDCGTQGRCCNGQCVSPPQCSNDDQCAQDQICIACACERLRPPECTSNSECVTLDRPICDTSSGVCVPCTADDQCSPMSPVCQEASGMCVQCETNDNCARNTFCDLSRFTCERKPAPAVFTVNSTADVVDNNPGDSACDTGRVTAQGQPECTLRAAIQESNALISQDVINLPAGTYVLNQALGELGILDDLSLKGTGASITIIDGNARVRVFSIRPMMGLQRGPLVDISNVTIRNGMGGIDNDGGTLTITNSAISKNSKGPGGGGGIDNDGGTLTITNSIISDNTSGAGGGSGGGGIFNRSGRIAITNSTISGNRLPSGNGRGGGIYNFGTVDLNNVTVTKNTAMIEGGGIFNSNTGTVNLKNTIIADNVDLRRFPDPFDSRFIENSPDCKGTLTSQGFNLIGNTGTVQSPSVTPSPACVIAATDNKVGGEIGMTRPINPRLDPLADNGGPTQTHALKAVFNASGMLIPSLSSPAIDAGSPDEPGSGGNACELLDQRGFRRPVDGDQSEGPRCDIGAFEWP